MPDGTDGVDHEARGKPEAGGDPGIAGQAGSGLLAQAAASSGPAARWIAPQTPPPGASAEFAAFTIASTASVVMSARRASRIGVVASLTWR